MTGGRAYLYDPEGRHLPALDARSVGGTRLSTAVATRDDGAVLARELHALLEAHRAAGSELATRLLAETASLDRDFWLVEPLAAVGPALTAPPQPWPNGVREPVAAARIPGEPALDRA